MNAIEIALLHTHIDDMYNQLAVLAAKRRAGHRDPGFVCGTGDSRDLRPTFLHKMER